ncbi:cation:proton antiporter [Serinicoccus chungangensis]|uniref:cation:proton antiporter n=1 Tax=Serinicoccus chungangensis TaxID=767452 RepID=UPI001118947E|nr:cation:proton antiporter [Serinicoccus chungangensis]
MTDILVVALAVLAFSVLAGRLGGTPVTMPMIFTTAGILLGPALLDVMRLDPRDELVSVLAEATLVVVLFTDASRLDLRTVVREHSMALRLLLVGLPAAVLVGTGAGWLLLPGMPLVALAVLAATLAPTDAALGQSFVESPSVPSRIRQTLNVESGLNDGLAVPFVVILIDVALDRTGSLGDYAVLLAQIVGLGFLVGGLSGWLGGRLLGWAHDRSWTTAASLRLGVVAVAGVAYSAAEVLGGNGFVASFVAGAVVGATARPVLEHTTTFARSEGQLLALLTFLLFGVAIVGDILADLEWRYVVYALASLLVVRMLATGLALLGSGVSAATVLYVGWAGPRGLASIVYAVLVVTTAGLPRGEEIFVVAGWTILLSVYLHGLSAAWVSRRYGASVERASGDRPEHRHTSHLPLRLPRAHRHPS